MKKRCALALLMTMLGNTLSSCVFTQSSYTPYVLSQTATWYTPWFVNYHIQPESASLFNRRGGEGCQVVESIEISPVDSNLMLLGTDTSGIWRSTDGGQNWYAVNNGIYMWAGIDFEFHPTDRNTVYMIQGEPNTSSYALENLQKHTYAGIYKSDDGGESFKQVLNETVFALSAANRLLRFDENENLYALTSQRLVKTADGGVNWSILKTFDFNVVNDLYVSNDGMTIIVADETNGITASFDGGISWASKNVGSASVGYSVDVDPFNASHWLAVFGGDNTGLYESTDSGQTWTDTLNWASNISGTPRNIMFGLRNDKQAIWYLVYRNQGQALRYSEDNGVTWKRPVVDDTGTVSEGTSGSACAGFNFDFTHPGVLYYSYADCIYKSTDYGKTFFWCNGGYSASRIDEFVFDEKGVLWLGAFDYGLFSTVSTYTSGGYPKMNTYIKNEGFGNYKSGRTVSAIGIDPCKNGHLIISLGRQTQQILKESYNNGLTWSVISGIEEKGTYNLIKFHNMDSSTIYTTFYISRDSGITWNENAIIITAVSEVNNDVLYGLSDKTAYKSIDKGLTWTGFYTGEQSVSWVYVDTNNQDSVWIRLKNGQMLHITKDAKVVLGELNGIDDEMLINAFAQNSNDSRHMLIGGQSAKHIKSNGIYESLDGGITWSRIFGLPSMGTVFEIAFSPITDEAFISGYTGGVIVYDYDAFHKYQSRAKSR